MPEHRKTCPERQKQQIEEADNTMIAEALDENSDRKPKPDYSPERLFVFGLRCVQNGFDTRYLQQWRDAWETYTRHFGADRCRPLLDALWEFVRIYRCHACSPTGYHRLDCPCMARDEYLSMALISALQHQDGNCAARCLAEITRGSGWRELESRAWALAAEFLWLRQRFRPVSIADIEATLQTTDALRDARNSTLH
ncbi:hypothetical protein [Roseibium aggregatum]|uniref:Uncharacterized protein n=1 Tax=Roseibium aggregatum TaxID=187304 RepID=A0A939EGG0_9HYPH|nr:hypothetical protein [Roseibium aggregatum]MBN9671738.1 hypothetical protein [Roseibium aggregatum]